SAPPPFPTRRSSDLCDFTPGHVHKHNCFGIIWREGIDDNPQHGSETSRIGFALLLEALASGLYCGAVRPRLSPAADLHDAYADGLSRSPNSVVIRIQFPQPVVSHANWRALTPAFRRISG